MIRIGWMRYPVLHLLITIILIFPEDQKYHLFCGFTYRKEEGVLLETYNEEMRMRFDVSHWMLNDMLKVNFNMVKTFHKNGPIDAAGLGIYRQAIMRNPTEPIWNEDGTFTRICRKLLL